MSYQILSVVLEIDAQSHEDGHFSIPKVVCDTLGLKSEDPVRLVIETLDGKLLFTGQKPLRSGLEIYGPEMKIIKAGQRIRVTVSRSGC